MLFVRAMMHFMVERDFLKLVSSVVASSLPGLCSVMSAVGEVTRVGAGVRPDVIETAKVRNNRACL